MFLEKTQLAMTSPPSPITRMTDSQCALLELGRLLRAADYQFTTPTPATHARVLIRNATARTLEDIFGWNMRFLPQTLGARHIALLKDAGALEQDDDGMRSTVRFSSLDGLLLVHSGFPTDGADAVFFGPDTYRFAREIRALFERHPLFRPQRVLDVGAGTGAAGFLCEVLGQTQDVSLLDINETALAYCAVNAALNERQARAVPSDVLQGVEGVADLIVSNPPYLVDGRRRTYRHGGGEWGADLSVCILKEALGRLAPGGKLLLYTGSAIVSGVDSFLKAARATAQRANYSFRYQEVDPDVFGEELERIPYHRAERIAVVCLTIE